MRAKDKGSLRKITVRMAMCLFVFMVLFHLFSAIIYASAGKTQVPGKVYEGNEDNHYQFSEMESFGETNEDNTYGVFSIGGNLSDAGSKDQVPVYEEEGGKLSFFYNYGDTLLNAGEDQWHVTEDKSRQIDDLTLEQDIQKGAIILQTSKDRLNWIDEVVMTNAFADTPVRTEDIYSATDVQLINGCFYRVIVAYELGIRTEDSNFLFINTDQYDYRKCVEVYEFYACTDSGQERAADSDQTYSLGSKVRVENFDGYSGEKEIDRDDIHYGWNLGNFFVSGYTDEVVGTDGRITFLKNVGDQVTLWFNLSENINRLNGKDNLTITADTEGYDQYFETPKMDFGRGALIIRCNEYNNVTREPVIYTNYLEANAVVDVDTKVQLFEEGDYEVALDYEVTSDEWIDKVGHYRIFFQFAVRNGNCMVYPFDVETGEELTNSSMTDHGFRLDLAKSRYLQVTVKREVLKDSADGLVEDTRFNGPAQEGAEYREEGIYTIAVNNQYTDQSTIKKIYVGTNPVLRAYLTTGLSIPEIKELMAQGAVISEDGTIEFAAQPTDQWDQVEEETIVSQAADDLDAEPAVESAFESAPEQEEGEDGFAAGVLGIGLLAGSVCVIFILGMTFGWGKAKKAKEHEEAGGGMD